ncbi:MAG: hypothetical protein WCF45_09135, partial [Photobacterium halotolerans]
NFQVVGAGSAYNWPGQRQRNQRLFWALFEPAKSVWRAYKDAERSPELKRDKPATPQTLHSFSELPPARQ